MFHVLWHSLYTLYTLAAYTIYLRFYHLVYDSDFNFFTNFRLLQYYVLREESGTLISSSFDRNKVSKLSFWMLANDFSNIFYQYSWIVKVNLLILNQPFLIFFFIKVAETFCCWKYKNPYYSGDILRRQLISMTVLILYQYTKDQLWHQHVPH